MATKTDDAIIKTAGAVTDLYTILVAALGALVKQQGGRPSEVRAQVQQALDMIEKAGPNMDAMLAAVRDLAE